MMRISRRLFLPFHFQAKLLLNRREDVRPRRFRRRRVISLLLAAFRSLQHPTLTLIWCPPNATVVTGSNLAKLTTNVLPSSDCAQPAQPFVHPFGLLIVRRLLDVIDDENLHWRFLRFKLQSKLFLNRRVEGRPGRFG